MKKNKNELSIWLCAGGTGGHISPAIAVAESFLDFSKNISIDFFSLPHNSAYPDIVALQKEERVKTYFYSAPRFPFGFKTSLLFLPKFFFAFYLLWRQYRKESAKPPAAFVAFGGYPVFPFLVFALIFGIPFYLCEQNAMPGKVTRLFARYAKRVFLSLPTQKEIPHAVLSGNPLRKKIREQFAIYNRQKTQIPKQQPQKILMVGGSQGARDLNRLYLAMINDPYFQEYQMEISVGQNMLSELQTAAAAHKRRDRVVLFITDMQRALLEADIIISRAGSGLLFEICAAGKGSVLVPFPFATDDHQAANACELQKLKLAKVLDVRPFVADQALAQLKTMLQDKDFWQKVALRYQKEAPLLLNAHLRIVENIIYDTNANVTINSGHEI